jgi:fatty acid desaturase
MTEQDRIEREKFARARRQVAFIKYFYVHLAVFCLVMATLLAVNAATKSSWWVQWPLLVWGVFLAGHALAVFGRVQEKIRNWEARKIRELKDKL